MEAKYAIPVVPQNLRQKETIIQITDALNYLSDVTDNIFSRITNRIIKNEENLKVIINRIENASNQVEKLRGAKKAIQVFSNSKYPGAEISCNYESVFNGKKLPVKKTKIEYNESYLSSDTLEKLQFYHVKIQNNSPQKSQQGLGNIPSNVSFVNDLILYNSGNNPYENYVPSDTLKLIHKTKEKTAAENSDIGAAPLSISDRHVHVTKNNDNYFYSPDLGEVPKIDVPLDLPDLPGIADDLRYNNETEPGIAPSVSTTPIVLDLPIIEIDSLQITPLPEENIKQPLPPVLETVEIEVPKVEKEPENKLQSNIIELPPDVVVEKVTPSSKKSDDGDIRASLMKAIRNAGGMGKAKLKSIEEQKSNDKPTSKITGDYMADLHAKLYMRRKGISGTKNLASSIDSASTLSKLSDIIPPPPPIVNTETTDTNTDDEDWNT